MTPDQERDLIKNLHAAGASEEQIVGALRKSRGVPTPEQMQNVQTGTLFPGAEGLIGSIDQIAKNPTISGVASNVLPIIGAILGGKVGRMAGEAVPVAQGARAISRIARGAMPFVRAGASSLGESLGLGSGIVANQAASGQPIDIPSTVGPMARQGALSLGTSGLAYLGGRAGGVDSGAAAEAVGRPGYVKPLPKDAPDLLARKMIKTVEETPLSPGKVKLNDMIAAKDLRGEFVDGEQILAAMEKARMKGSSAEAVAANRRLSGDIARLRAEMHTASQEQQTPPLTMAAAPPVAIPGATRTIPETVIPPSGGTPAGGMPHDQYGMTEGFPRGNLLPSQGMTLPGGTVSQPPVSVPPVQPTTVPPHLQGAYGATSPRPGTAGMALPLTATQANDIIERSLTKPVQEDLQGRIGGQAYGDTRVAARNHAAQEFYSQLGPGAKEAGAAASEYLSKKEKMQAYFPADKFGDPRLSTPGRIRATQAPTNASGPTLMKKIAEYDAAVPGANLGQAVLELDRKGQWGPNEQRNATYISSILQPGRAGVRETGDLRASIRALARQIVRLQGKTGAAARAAIVAPNGGRVKARTPQEYESIYNPTGGGL